MNAAKWTARARDCQPAGRDLLKETWERKFLPGRIEARRRRSVAEIIAALPPPLHLERIKMGFDDVIDSRGRIKRGR